MSKGAKHKRKRADEHAHAHAHDDQEHDQAHAHDDHQGHAHAGLGGPVAGSLLEPLAPGAGAGKWLFLDCPSGIAGDMTVGALLDLGVPLDAVREALSALDLSGYKLEVERRRVGSLAATAFSVLVTRTPTERSYASIDALLEASRLAGPVRTLSRAIFRRLAEAEGSVHGVTPEQVHFHEVGAIDSIVDIVAAAAGFVHLGAKVGATPLPMGHGFVTTRHGRLPLPAPATLLCLRGVPTYGADIEAELVTPTGAVIVATVATEFTRWPSFMPERIGLGAGQRVLPDRPNVLRMVLGQPSPLGAPNPQSDTHVLLEANLDDITGELAGHAIATLLEAGALDAWATAITMKKGRPALQLSALATASRANEIAEVMLRETTTIGVRRSLLSRIERPRQTIHVATRYGSLPVKVSETAAGPAQVKPEFDACLAAAERHGVAVRVVLAEALAAYFSGQQPAR